MRTWLPLLLTGCFGTDLVPDSDALESDTETDADTDADSDADTDSDTDADTDSDTDADTDSDTDADTDSDVDPISLSARMEGSVCGMIDVVVSVSTPVDDLTMTILGNAFEQAGPATEFQFSVPADEADCYPGACEPELVFTSSSGPVVDSGVDNQVLVDVFVDVDGDGVGGAPAGDCAQPVVEVAGDCDDANPLRPNSSGFGCQCGAGDVAFADGNAITSPVEVTNELITILEICPGDVTVGGTVSNNMRIWGHSGSTLASGLTVEASLEASDLTIRPSFGTPPMTVRGNGMLDVSTSTFDCVGSPVVQNGGAIASSGSLELNEVTIRNCRATLSGGAIELDDGAAALVAVTFEENASLRGGAIHAEQGVVLEMEDVEFVDNGVVGGISAIEGGAIWASRPPTISAGAVFRGNEASLGGAVYISDPHAGSWMIDAVTFAGNTARDGGAAVWTPGGLIGTNLVLQNNASAEGGAPLTIGGTLELTDTDASGNSGFSAGVADVAGPLTLQGGVFEGSGVEPMFTSSGSVCGRVVDANTPSLLKTTATTALWGTTFTGSPTVEIENGCVESSSGLFTVVGENAISGSSGQAVRCEEGNCQLGCPLPQPTLSFCPQ